MVSPESNLGDGDHDGQRGRGIESKDQPIAPSKLSLVRREVSKKKLSFAGTNEGEIR